MKYFIIFLGICGLSCNTTTQPDKPVGLERVWSINNPTGQLALTMQPIVYENKVVYSWFTIDEPQGPLQAYNKSDGTLIWTWDDYFEDETAYLSSWTKTYVQGNIFVFALSRGVYAINLDNGETLWRAHMNRSDANLSGMGNNFFCVGNSPDRYHYFILKGDITTGAMDTVFQVSQQGGDDVLDISVPIYYQNTVGDTMLAFSGSIYDYDSLQGAYYKYFFNMSKDTLLKRIDEAEGAPDNRFWVSGSNVYFGSSQSYTCYDGSTANKKWRNPIPATTGTIGAILYNGNFYYGTEGINPILICADAETGQEKWRIASSGTSGWMSVYNDVIYYNGGGDGKMHCVDAITGEVLGLFESPDVAQNSNAFFDSGLSIDPTTGRIYTGNYIKAYCFEPIR